MQQEIENIWSHWPSYRTKFFRKRPDMIIDKRSIVYIATHDQPIKDRENYKKDSHIWKIFKKIQIHPFFEL